MLLRNMIGRAPLAAVLALLVTAVPAAATFPGRNGSIVVGVESGRGVINARLEFIDFEQPEHDELFVCSELFFGADYCLYPGAPALSPDGTRAAVVSDDTSVDEAGVHPATGLRVIALSDGSRTRVSIVSPGPYGERPDVAWSPDGRELVATRDGGLYRLGLDGVERGLLVAGAASPDWAADGRIAFVRDGDVWAGPSDGPFHRLTVRGGSSPSWSPHGRWIAFSRGHGVWVVASRGGAKARRVVKSGSARRYITYQSPTWSPDGRQIAYYRESRGELSLNAVDWHTRAVQRLTGELTSAESSVSAFAWQSLPR